MKSVIAERNLRTVATLLYKLMDFHNNFRWFDYVKDVQHAFNNTHHSSLPKTYTPAQVIASPKIAKEVKLNYQRKANQKNKHYESKMNKKPPIFEGDFVRTLKKKNIFSKSYQPRFSEDIHRVVQVRDWTVPPTYRVENHHRWWYLPELSLVRVEPKTETHAPPETNYYISQTRKKAGRETRSGQISNQEIQYLVKSVSDKSFSHWLSEAEVIKLRKKGQILDLSSAADS